MKVVRDLRWFEKFYWFISSEGYLILGYVYYCCILTKVPVIHNKRDCLFGNTFAREMYTSIPSSTVHAWLLSKTLLKMALSPPERWRRRG